MRIKLPSFLSGLLFKLLFAYLAVTLVSWIISSTLLGLFEYHNLRQSFAPDELVAAYASKISASKIYLDEASTTAALTSQLSAIKKEIVSERRDIAPDIYSNYEKFDFNEDTAAVYNLRGEILTAKQTLPNEKNLSAGTTADTQKAQSATAAILGGAEKFSVENADQSATIALPLKNSRDELGGVLVVHSKMPLSLGATIYKLTWNWFDAFGTMLVMFAATGLIFSFLLGREFVRRLKLISAAADAWSVGDFSARAADGSGDEIGHLARRLNGMARDLSDFFRLKQELAAAAERSKIARDLHDSVKQQVFALSMQLGAANLLRNQNFKSNSAEAVAVADRHLAEAENLAQNVQRELVDLINELRPASEPLEPLAARLKNLAADWKRQNKIPVALEIDEAPLPSPIEYALFRIVQESLANTARHGAAQKISINLKKTAGDGWRLVVADDGRGFDPPTVKKGLGLDNMRERGENLPGGRFFIETEENCGVKIIVEFCADESNAAFNNRTEKYL